MIVVVVAVAAVSVVVVVVVVVVVDVAAVVISSSRLRRRKSFLYRISQTCLNRRCSMLALSSLRSPINKWLLEQTVMPSTMRQSGVRATYSQCRRTFTQLIIRVVRTLSGNVLPFVFWTYTFRITKKWPWLVLDVVPCTVQYSMYRYLVLSLVVGGVQTLVTQLFVIVQICYEKASFPFDFTRTKEHLKVKP